MKKHSFLAGMLTMALIVGLCMSALAATGQVSFNASALKLNGQQISAAGENYTLANGQSVPASITYTDEKGGGTTYLPVRRVSELLGVEVGWDGAVTLTGEVKAAETTTPPVANYSDWTAEEEKAYQEFKGLWIVQVSSTNADGTICSAKYKGALSDQDLIAQLQRPEYSALAERLAWESYSGTLGLYLVFYGAGEGIGSIWISDGKIMQSYFS